jgi:hypothetical protein
VDAAVLTVVELLERTGHRGAADAAGGESKSSQ